MRCVFLYERFLLASTFLAFNLYGLSVSARLNEQVIAVPRSIRMGVQRGEAPLEEHELFIELNISVLMELILRGDREEEAVPLDGLFL
jgi:hypothetical protein